MDALLLLVAVLLLLAGRRLFWVFVAFIGFAAGFTLAAEAFPNANENELLLFSAILGLLGMILAFFLQKAAIALAGFLGGAIACMTIMELLGVPVEGLHLLFVMLAGFVGVLLLAALFDVALVLLSTVAGSTLLVQAFTPEQPYDMLLFITAIVIGLVVQFRMISPAPRPAPA